MLAGEFQKCGAHGCAVCRRATHGKFQAGARHGQRRMQRNTARKAGNAINAQPIVCNNAPQGCQMHGRDGAPQNRDDMFFAALTTDPVFVLVRGNGRKLEA